MNLFLLGYLSAVVTLLLIIIVPPYFNDWNYRRKLNREAKRALRAAFKRGL